MIVIGGSTGGLHAVQTLLRELPTRFEMPVVIVLHRRADIEDILTPLLQRTCLLPVSEVIDKQPLQNGRVYVAPADYHVLIDRDYLSLSIDERVHYARPSIDVLFESAALMCGRRTVGVVLTGAGWDGAAGAAAIERHGGQVLIEDPATALQPSLPAAAQAATVRATVLSIEKIAARLLEIAARAPEIS